MSTTLLEGAARAHNPPAASRVPRGLLRDSLLQTVAGQVGRVLGVASALALRWGLDPAALGVYGGLKLYLDQTNRSSLGVAQGGVQLIPILRSSGRVEDALQVRRVASTLAIAASLVYAVLVLGWCVLRQPLVQADPQATRWTWGLVSIALLTPVHRLATLRLSLLRADRRFAEVTRVELVEAAAAPLLLILGVLAAGFWGVIAAAGLVLILKQAMLARLDPLPLGLEWRMDWPLVRRLFWVGFPIFLNGSLLAFLTGIDRVLILWLMPDGASAVGLYSIALLGTSWAIEIAGRTVVVLYTYLQESLGSTGAALQAAQMARRSTETLAVILAAGGVFAFLAGPPLLTALFPRYAGGVPALRWLMPGIIALALGGPTRQLLIAREQPLRLGLATCVGCLLAVLIGGIGARSGSLAGVALGVSIAHAAVLLICLALALAPVMGTRDCLDLIARLAVLAACAGAGIMAAELLIDSGPHFLQIAAGVAVAELCVVLGAVALWPDSSRLVLSLLRNRGGDTAASAPNLQPNSLPP